MSDFSEPFIIETDTSGSGLGVVLLQEQPPLLFTTTHLVLKLILNPWP